MKSKAILLALSALATATYSCKKLDVPVESQFVASNFPKTISDYNASVGAMYSNLSSQFAVPYWRMQTMSTDEAIIPARDGNFDDGGQYRQLHYHTWTPDHPNVLTIWQWAYGGITTCNRLLNVTTSFGFTPAEEQARLAEIRAMRALYYFFLLDLYGNVPLVTDYPVAASPATKSRAEVYKFIESELTSLTAKLPTKTVANATQQYGRPTKGMVYALLAKLYLNAEVYTGAARYPDVVRMADSVQANTNYALDARYRDIFLPNNGPQIRETIFAVPYDQQIPGNQFTRFGFFSYLGTAYGFNVGLSIAMSTTPEFYARFNLPGDTRTRTWLAGPQFMPDGNGGFTTTPVYYPSPNNTTQIVINPVLTLVPPKPMDVGNTIATQSQGVRSIKYYPDANIIQATRLNGNDVPLLRLADVMLMKAEAILRGAPATSVNGELQTPLVLVNKIRARAGAQQTTSISLNGMLDERARELSWEAWRRNDLIRFGQFETEYPLPNDVLKMDKSTFRRLYPVPTIELRLNSNLVQNTGY